MARTTSIPSSLHTAIVDRFTLGQSPERIARWLNGTNAGRKEQVHTSRSSVNRLIQRLVCTQADQRRLATINRARFRAPDVQRRIEQLERDFVQCVAAADDLDGTPEARARFSGRLQALSKLGTHLARERRAAGAVGAAADRAVLQWDAVLLAMRERVNAAGEAPVRDEAPNTLAGSGNETDTPALANDDADGLPRPPMPETLAAYEEGLAHAPCRITTVRAAAQLETHELPLSEDEAVYAAGYAMGWASLMAAAETPPALEELREKTVAEMQFQMQLLALQTLALDADGDRRASPDVLVQNTEVVTGTVLLAPLTEVPPPFNADRASAEAYRLGSEDTVPRMERLRLDPKSPGRPEEVLLTPAEEAWCAGHAAFLLSEVKSSTRRFPGDDQGLVERIRSSYQRSKWMTSLGASNDLREQPPPREAPEAGRTTTGPRAVAPGSPDAWQPASPSPSSPRGAVRGGDAPIHPQVDGSQNAHFLLPLPH